MASTAKLIPILSRRSYVPDRPRHLINGAVMAAYHIFDELAPEVPASELLSSVRKAISAASAIRQRNSPDGHVNAADSGTARAMAAIDKIAKRVLSNRPGSWCDVVAIAELAAFHAGAREFDDVRKAFDVNKPHERFAAELVRTVLGLAAGDAPEVTASADTAPLAYVYLAQSGHYFKIGRTFSPAKRKYALAIQLPDRLEMLHTIITDDPVRVEQYWHTRFADQRKNGEWFSLSATDIAAFKAWTATERIPSGNQSRVRVKLRATMRVGQRT